MKREYDSLVLAADPWMDRTVNERLAGRTAEGWNLEHATMVVRPGGSTGQGVAGGPDVFIYGFYWAKKND